MLKSEEKEFLLSALQSWYKDGLGKVEKLIKNLWTAENSVSIFNQLLFYGKGIKDQNTYYKYKIQD